MSFLSKLTETVNIRRQAVTPDDDGGPVATWPVVYAGVKARVEDRNPKLHGNQLIGFMQPIVGIAHNVFVLGLYPTMGTGNGWAVEFDIQASGGTGAFGRVVELQRERAIGNMPAHTMLICEETGG